jgi:signal peptidase I
MDLKWQSRKAPAASPEFVREIGGGRSVTAQGQADGDSWWSYGGFVIKVVVVVALIRVLLVSPFSIPSESMLPRLWTGDYLLLAKWPYGFSRESLPFEATLPSGRLFAGEPEHGDVVIFKHPIDRTDYIKRVIALPGDTIAIREGQLVLNGTPVPQTRLPDFDIPVTANTSCDWGGRPALAPTGEIVCRYRRYRETLPGGRSYAVLDYGPRLSDEMPVRTIPAGQLFVLGDNRDNSRDSRFDAQRGDATGIVPQDNLVGEALILIWSTDGSAQWSDPVSWFTAARWHRIGSVL